MLTCRIGIAWVVLIALAMSIFGCSSNPLALAAMRGDEAALNQLLTEPSQLARINEKWAVVEKDGPNTPLGWAMTKDDAIACRMGEKLIACGAQVNVIGGLWRNSPFDIAANGRKLQSVAMLLRHGADPNLASLSQRWCLRIAIDHKDLEMMKILLTAGADPNADMGYGLVPLLHAVISLRCTDPPCVDILVKISKLLLEVGADARLPAIRQILNEKAVVPPEVQEVWQESIKTGHAQGSLHAPTGEVRNTESITR